MGNAIIRDDIRLGYNFDERGNELSFRCVDGRWREQTYDTRNNELSYEDNNKNWRRYTRDATGNELTYEDSDGDWRKFTRDAAGNELTYENQHGVWLTLANSGHTLRYLNGVYWAGCRRFTRDEALAHWGDRLNYWVETARARAKCFIEAINNHESDDSQVKD
jgi:hypothetical protein